MNSSINRGDDPTATTAGEPLRTHKDDDGDEPIVTQVYTFLRDEFYGSFGVVSDTEREQ